MKQRKRAIVLLTLFFVITLFLTFNRHSKSGIQNYHSEIWADKAGYYVYLPALFIYQFHAEEFPHEIDVKTGKGFSIENNILKTKYTCGVALMQSPFFIIGHLMAKSSGVEDDGFSLIYNKMIDVAAVVYTFLSFIILYFFLIRFLPERTAIITLSCLYLGTNIFYYSIFDTGMSHIYSFFLFSSFLFLSPLILELKPKIINCILFGLVVGLIIVVRPINIFILPVFFIFNKFDISSIKASIIPLLLIGASAFLIVLPQLCYWKYAYGHYFYYAYESEGFPYFFSPKFLYIWFAARNGLFIYNPIFVFVIAGIFRLYKISPGKSILIGTYFLFISYLFASWHDWSYGCSYGCRPYVEYYALLSLPFGYFINKIQTINFKTSILLILMIVLILYNLKIIFTFDGCFYGDAWDWNEVLRLIVGRTK